MADCGIEVQTLVNTEQFDSTLGQLKKTHRLLKKVIMNEYVRAGFGSDPDSWPTRAEADRDLANTAPAAEPTPEQLARWREEDPYR